MEATRARQSVRIAHRLTRLGPAVAEGQLPRATGVLLAGDALFTALFLVLLLGGLFLLWKSTREIHGKLEGEDGATSSRVAPSSTLRRGSGRTIAARTRAMIGSGTFFGANSPAQTLNSTSG